MTFCVTCVVESIVVTHFRNPVAGNASGTSRVDNTGEALESSIRERIVEDSNQNKQVI